MDQRAIVDVVCKSGLENLAGEVGALLGQELICSDIQLNLTSKENLFSNLERHKTALTRMTVEGDREGDCYLLTRISSAAILGGTLIMLPEDVIEESAQNENLMVSWMMPLAKLPILLPVFLLKHSLINTQKNSVL